MAITNPFSMSTMFNALQDLSFNPARETMYEEPPTTIPPPLDGDSLFRCGISAGLTPEVSEMDLAWVFNFMTRSEDVPRFEDVISMLDREKLQRMAYILTSDSGYFMDIARTKHGSKNLRKLMGKSDDVDAFFYAVIMRLFFEVMTDKHASYVAIKGMQVFQPVRKELLYEKVLQYALHLARDEHGCIALNEVITDLDDPYYRNQLLDIVAYNALLLSNDAYGNFVVQHVLKLYDLRSTRNIAVNLRGHCVELSFKKYGSYIVERLLEAEDSVMELVVMDLLECEGERLMRLARSEYGNFVVKKGLLFTRDIFTAHLFYGLVHKLMPFRHLLPRSPGRNIATILDSLARFVTHTS